PSEVNCADLDAWNALLQQGAPLELASRSEYTAVWDLGHYVCGYPHLSWDGGSGAQIEVEWAESLYEEANAENVTAHSPKGQRDAVAKKVWLGFGDTFIADGKPCSP